jgi:hypothetical protein
MIDPALELSIAAQCRLLDVARSFHYYERVDVESDDNLALMQVID